MPMQIDAPRLEWMQEKLDFDLDASRIAFRDGEPIGLANLAVRGPEAWIGGVGVVASARRSGVGEALMRAVHEEARSRGVERVWLEVIVTNAGALRALREARLRTRAGRRGLDAAGRRRRAHRARGSRRRAPRLELPERHEPWQRAAGTLAHYDDVRGLLADDGAMLFCVRSTAQLQRYTGEPRALAPRAPHLRGRLHPQPSGEDPAATALARARRLGRRPPARDAARALTSSGH